MDEQTREELGNLFLNLRKFYRKNRDKLKTPIKAKHFITSLALIQNVYNPKNDCPTVKKWRLENIRDTFFKIKPEFTSVKENDKF